jgi:ABC-2 type transport system permease protein
VFLAVFAFSAGAFALSFGGFFAARRAELSGFFQFLPWLYLVFLPALAMRLWSEDLRTGAVELLLTTPISLPAAAIGKFAAAWTVAGVGLALTAPIWIAANLLGDPDNGAIAAGYLGALLMAGGYLGIGAAVSASTANQVIAFVVAVAISFFLTVSGLPIVVDAAAALLPTMVVEAIAWASPLERFQSIARGVVAARDVFYFASLAALGTALSVMIIAARRGG